MTEKKTVIETLLDGVAWESTSSSGPGASTLPFVTHEGRLKLPMLNGLEIQVLQLSDGKRIIPNVELERIFDAMGARSCAARSPGGLPCQLSPHIMGKHRHYNDPSSFTEWE